MDDALIAKGRDRASIIRLAKALGGQDAVAVLVMAVDIVGSSYPTRRPCFA
ncbi:MAG: hypothetical protein J2P54_14375 [Bradyrhizobiaceae bacterium]|nr:hypothetical protein [Bradyrhizobiaceae bacterium]